MCDKPQIEGVGRGKTYCKSRIFRMHFIFVYFVRGGFRTKIKCILKIQSKSENLQRSAAVRKFHAYERSGVRRIRKFSAYEIFWIYSIWNALRLEKNCELMRCLMLPFSHIFFRFSGTQTPVAWTTALLAHRSIRNMENHLVISQEKTTLRMSNAVCSSWTGLAATTQGTNSSTAHAQVMDERLVPTLRVSRISPLPIYGLDMSKEKGLSVFARVLFGFPILLKKKRRRRRRSSDYHYENSMWGKCEEISSHFPHYFLTFSTLFPHKKFLTLALEIGRIPHIANVRKNVRKM